MNGNHIFEDPALTMQAVAYSPVLPYREGETKVPQGLTYTRDGLPVLTVYAPGASQVRAEFGEQSVQLLPKGGGLWSRVLEAEPGFYYLHLWADQIPLMTPMLPVGYGYCRPTHYLDIGPLPELCRLTQVPHGAVRHEYYLSSVTGTQECCIVYTPPGYEQDPKRQYPVLYLQHGHGENETGWVWQGKVNLILDNLIARGEAVPMIVVMNNGMLQQSPEFGDSPVSMDLFAERLIRDVIPFIEERYQVLADREHRAVAGLSMGSMQASMLGFGHRELFAWMGLFSGFMRNEMGTNGDNRHLEILLENREEFLKGNRLLFRCMGREDVFWDRFERDDQFCQEHHIPCTRKVYSGGHDWNVWRQAAGEFLPLLFRE